MYLDVYFLINLVLDRCSLGCALRRYRLSGLRLWIGAAVGAVGACIWEVSGWPLWLRPMWAFLLAVLMLFVCIGERNRRQWLKSLIEMYGFSFFFAGVIPYVSRFLPIWSGAVLVSYMGIKLWLVWQEKRTVTIQEIQIETEYAAWKMKAMVDTGHNLKEPITGKPVVIIRKSCLPNGIKPQWPICYESVQGGGVMFGFWPKRLMIGERSYKEREILVAVAPEWRDESCEALIPGYVMK